MKQITCFITSLSNGGAERQLAILASMLAEKGYDVSLVTFSGDEDEYSYNSKIHRVRIQHSGSNISKLLSIFKYYLSVKTDCVISFGARVNFLAIIPLFFRKRVKIIAGERCATFEGMTWYKKLNYRCLYKRADYIVPNNYTQKKEIEQLYPYLLPKTHVITNYTDLNQYTVHKNPQNQIIRVGVFCRYAKQKNYLRFAEALKTLKETSDMPFHVDWYGNSKVGSEDNPEFLSFSKLVDDYSINDIITLHGRASNVAELIPVFDVLCLPSLGEGFSNTISEYICCGKPVVCSDVADNSIMVKDGVNGFLFDPNKTEEIAKALKRIFTLGKDKREQMGHESRIIAERLFDKDKFIASYIKLIEE